MKLSIFKISKRNNDNSSPRGHGSPNETDRKRLHRLYQSKTFKVKISFAVKIQIQEITNTLRGQEMENSQETLRVLDIILRQHAAKHQDIQGEDQFYYQNFNAGNCKCSAWSRVGELSRSIESLGYYSKSAYCKLVSLRQHVAKQNSGNSSPYRHEIPNETDRKRLRYSYQSKTFKLKISFAVKIQMQVIANALCGQESENSQEALRDRDIHYFWSYNQQSINGNGVLDHHNFQHQKMNGETDAIDGDEGFNGR
ncbi:hypothetical protein CQW23_24420 [Capsicum baccatum]|uniref:Protein argonaute N-terminal domain-containing protein n=1 Tax=Capsicum baccatum TaxID=33114 RepID=A0A2G2VUQ0_CAPBA|nr:hypothetical protein CQW23_24420 [Capsicum baccatum]